MLSKTFELTVPFARARDPATGRIYRLPIVKATFAAADGNPIELHLLFDTGANFTTLRHSLAPALFGASWDSGEPRQRATATGTVQAYGFQATIEVFGKKVTCQIDIDQFLIKCKVNTG